MGKSTLSAEMADTGAFVIPEVNLLMARPQPEPPDWYLDRQNVRWEMAAYQSRRGVTAVLDSDPFQPLWFNWIFAAEGWNWREAYAFYRERIHAGRMAFPDRYWFLTVAEPVRRERMMARELARGSSVERATRKVDRYASLVEPQRRYFLALAERFPGWVVTLDTATLPATDVRLSGAVPDSREVIDFAGEWLGRA